MPFGDSFRKVLRSACRKDSTEYGSGRCVAFTQAEWRCPLGAGLASRVECKAALIVRSATLAERSGHAVPDRGLWPDRRLPDSGLRGPRRVDRLAVRPALRFPGLLRRPAGDCR